MIYGVQIFLQKTNIYKLSNTFQKSCMSPIMTRNTRGLRTLPWRTPEVTGWDFDEHPFTQADCVLALRNALKKLSILPEILLLLSFSRAMPISTLSNALAKSKYMTSTFAPFSRFYISRGPSTEPRGTPHVISLTSDDSPLRKTYCFLLLK